MARYSVGHAWERTKTIFIPCYHKISSGLPKVGVLSCECRTERRHREGVDQWNYILGCVSVGYMNTYEAKFYPMLSQDLPSGLPKLGVLSYECRTSFSCGVGVVCEACHTLEFYASTLNVPPHFYTYILGPMHDLVGFRRSEAPASGETLTS